MTAELIANGDGGDYVKMGIDELEMHANLGGSFLTAEDERQQRGLPGFAGKLIIPTVFLPPGAGGRDS
ncbi:MAG: hypothetical protein ABI602_03745 [Candidatus Saccharibacteria bacterium]